MLISTFRIGSGQNIINEQKLFCLSVISVISGICLSCWSSTTSSWINSTTFILNWIICCWSCQCWSQISPPSSLFLQHSIWGWVDNLVSTNETNFETILSAFIVIIVKDDIKTNIIHSIPKFRNNWNSNRAPCEHSL